MNTEKPFDPNDPNSSIWEAMFAPVPGATVNASAGSIDTPVFDDLLTDYAHAMERGGDIAKCRAALIAHIDRHTREAVQAARKEPAGELTADQADAIACSANVLVRHDRSDLAIRLRSILATKKEQANG